MGSDSPPHIRFGCLKDEVRSLSLMSICSELRTVFEDLKKKKKKLYLKKCTGIKTETTENDSVSASHCAQKALEVTFLVNSKTEKAITNKDCAFKTTKYSHNSTVHT